MIPRPCLPLIALAFLPSHLHAEEKRAKGYADSNGVKIHYVTQGKGPLVVMLHGFPDYWHTWHDQMSVLSKHFKVVAIDLRGYNKSDQPKGVENYRIEKLVGDVDAVLAHFKAKKAIIVGHDWGGFIAWSFAMARPKKTDRLIVLNSPHPKGLMRELINNPAQQKASEYARNFQKEDAAAGMSLALKVSPGSFAFWIKDEAVKKKHVEALQRSSMEGMLSYYKANYPKAPYKARELPKVKCSVLMIHGLKDKYLLSGALNGTWEWVEKDLTLVTIPNAGHFVQSEASEVVSRKMLQWLTEK